MHICFWPCLCTYVKDTQFVTIQYHLWISSWVLGLTFMALYVFFCCHLVLMWVTVAVVSDACNSMFIKLKISSTSRFHLGVSETDSWPLHESAETGWEIFYTGRLITRFLLPPKLSIRIFYFDIRMHVLDIYDCGGWKSIIGLFFEAVSL